MRHAYFGKKLSRTKNERRRLFQSLARELFMHGGIVTTLAKAKAVQPLIEKLITKAKRGDASDMMQIRKVLAEKNSVVQLLQDAKTRFATRSSGFTRILKLDSRISDRAKMAQLSFVDAIVDSDTIKPKKIVPKSKPVDKKIPAVKKNKPKVAKTKKG
jgi:large subunit ribosomal protein L17